MNKWFINIIVLCFLVALGGCVSSSLNSVKNTEPAVQKEPDYDLALREEAVAEMRAKAENKSGKKTNVFRNQDGPGKPLSQSQINARMRELNSIAEAQENTVSDDEVAAKKRTIKELRKRANTHYEDRLEKIESE